MNSMKKVLIIMQLLALIISGNGCAKGESIISNSENNVLTTEAVFEPIPVPENGWTMEELAKTIRINGTPISYPFTVGSLSEDYRLVDAHRVLIADPVNSGFIEYKGTLIVGVGLERNSQIDDNYENGFRYYYYYENGYEDDNDKGFLCMSFYNEELIGMDFVLEKNSNK